MSNDNRFVKDTMTIIYYCSERRKKYRRMIKVDRDLELQRKINSMEFALLPEGPYGHRALVVKRIDGRYLHPSRNGDTTSIPALLFGAEYYKSKRINQADHFDLRKEAFIPSDYGQENFISKFKQDHI